MDKCQKGDLGMEAGLLQHVVCTQASVPFSRRSAVLNGKCAPGIPHWFSGLVTCKELLTCV